MIYGKIDCTLVWKLYSPDVTTFTCSVTGLRLRLPGIGCGFCPAKNLGVPMTLVPHSRYQELLACCEGTLTWGEVSVAVDMMEKTLSG